MGSDGVVFSPFNSMLFLTIAFSRLPLYSLSMLVLVHTGRS